MAHYKERLTHACLELHTLKISEAPEDLRPRYQKILGAIVITEPRLRGQGRIEATVSRMQRSTAERLADEIWLLGDEMDRRFWDS